MCVLAWIYVHHECAGTHRGQKKVLEPLELELHKILGTWMSSEPSNNWVLPNPISLFLSVFTFGAFTLCSLGLHKTHNRYYKLSSPKFVQNVRTYNICMFSWYPTSFYPHDPFQHSPNRLKTSPIWLSYGACRSSRDRSQACDFREL